MHLMPAGLGILISYILIGLTNSISMNNGNFQNDVFYGMSSTSMMINQIQGSLITALIAMLSGAGLGAILMVFRKHHVPSDVYGDHVFFKMSKIAPKESVNIQPPSARELMTEAH